MAEEVKGKFHSDLTRNFKQLREDRAEAVVEDVEIVYKRRVEDLCKKVRQCDRDRDNIMLNLAPTTVHAATVIPADFDANKFLDEDVRIGLAKRDALIQLEIVATRYVELFGPLEGVDVAKYIPSFKNQ